MLENIDDEILSGDQLEDFSEEKKSESLEEEIEVEEIEIVEGVELPVEEKKKDFVPSYWNIKYTFEQLNAMDTFEITDLLEDKNTAVNTKALIIQVLASRGVYID